MKTAKIVIVSDTTIECEDLGGREVEDATITVRCQISGGGVVYQAVPQLTVDMYVPIEYIEGEWICLIPLQARGSR